MRLSTIHYLTASIFALSLLASPVSGQTLTDEDEQLVQTIIEQLRRDAYDSALAAIDTLRLRRPEAPHSYFLAADAYQTMMRDYRVRLYETEFDSLIELTQQKARRIIKKHPTPQHYFILGASQGYVAVHQFYDGEWMRAIQGAVRAMQTMQAAASIDREFVDPLLGLSMYEFAKSKALGFGVDLFKSSRRQALAQLQVVQQHGQYVRANAAYSRQMIHYSQEEYAEALAINDMLFAKYPQNPSCLYHRALLLEAVGRYAEAREIWRRLLERIWAFDAQSNGYLAECHLHLAEIAWHLGEHQGAQTKLEEAATFADNHQKKFELQGPYGDIDDIRDGIKALRRRLDQGEASSSGRSGQ